MDSLQELEYHASELGTAVQDLARHIIRSNEFRANSASRPIIDTQNPDEVNQARKGVLSHIARIKTLVCAPTEFLEHLASQTEMLACLRWLGKTQILACIPRIGSVPIKDVANLAGVEETQLCRVVRLTATGGFLKEDPRGHVGHTALSDPFFSNPLLLDAAMFMAESAAPAALNMAITDANSVKGTHPSAYDLALNTWTPFHIACEQNPRLSRQYSAYLQYAAGLHVMDGFADVLKQLCWSNISQACVVEVGAHSTATARKLAELYPNLRFVVQLIDPASLETSHRRQLRPLLKLARAAPTFDADLSPHITVAARTLGSRQTTTDADVYIVHLPSNSSSTVLAELQLHRDILRASNAIMLIPTAHLLPEPGSTVDPEAEAVARSRDLGLLQLVNEREMELAELLDMIDTVKDSAGKLAVTKRLHSSSNLVVALVIKYQMEDADNPQGKKNGFKARTFSSGQSY
ncbi:hypothetical protein B0H67DRAFT_559073 [Lasiosphaeris hirsuta]|uniref:O-methyltransferase n=1 Tax=Lasiosphaeris hirsuta TaxID=260670 RepID=A0AA40B8G0_9PEZI|nr:hypothetical protein B0H67DRAFT_559073 [Lasiosphaeris hirsuta]